MELRNRQPETIDAYIECWPDDIRRLLEQMRAAIRKAAPTAVEKISYGIPTYTLHGNLVHFAAFKNHIGFYPSPTGIAAFKKELSAYDGAKGSVQFTYGKPLPLALIAKIVKYRVRENIEKAERKMKG